MQKKTMLALMLAMTLILSGCNLVVKDPAVDAATEIVRLGDTVYTKAEVMDTVDYNLSYMSYMYSAMGSYYNMSDPTVISNMKDSVVNQITENVVKLAKAKELGLDQFTDEEKAEISETAENNWKSIKSSIQSVYFPDTELTGDALDEALAASATDLGYSLEQYTKQAEETKLLDKLRTETVKDISVTEEELQAELNTHAEEDKADYESDPGAYAKDLMDGTDIYYRPAGYRMIKQILVKFSDEDSAAINELKSAADAASTKADNLVQQLDAVSSDTDLLVAAVSVVRNEQPEASDTDLFTAEGEFPEGTDEAAADLARQIAVARAEAADAEQKLADAQAKAFANIDAAADEVLAKIAAGEDFSQLAAEYSGDKDANGNVNNPDGYAVAEGVTAYDSAFTDGAMALSGVGEVSGKIQGMYGYYILKYDSDVEEGPVALDDVRETLNTELLAEKQDAYFTEQTAQWVKESPVKVDRKALDD